MYYWSYCKDCRSCEKAEADGADYLGCGAIYPTKTHVKTKITSVETLNDICAAVNIPVCAIGGLNKDNLSVLEKSPIQGVCVVSAIMDAEDTKRRLKSLKNRFKRLWHNKCHFYFVKYNLK